MVFTSNDKLHVQTVPLFMRGDQEFVPGDELKADLHRLDEHFSHLPQDVLDRGLFSFEPPLGGDYLTTRLWRKFLPNWHPERRVGKKHDPEADAEVLARFNAERAAPAGPPVGVDAADFVIMERAYPFKVGKYRLFSHEVEERERARLAVRAADKSAKTERRSD